MIGLKSFMSWVVKVKSADAFAFTEKLLKFGVIIIYAYIWQFTERKLSNISVSSTGTFPIKMRQVSFTA